MKRRWIRALMLVGAVLLLGGCVVEPVPRPPPGVVVVPGHYAYGPWGPYYMAPGWRYVP